MNNHAAAKVFIGFIALFYIGIILDKAIFGGGLGSINGIALYIWLIYSLYKRNNNARIALGILMSLGVPLGVSLHFLGLIELGVASFVLFGVASVETLMLFLWKPIVRYTDLKQVQPAEIKIISDKESDVRNVSFSLGIGISFAPIIFAWFTLREGHSTFSRIISFSWLFIGLLYVLIPKFTDYYVDDRTSHQMEYQTEIE